MLCCTVLTHDREKDAPLGTILSLPYFVSTTGRVKYWHLNRLALHSHSFFTSHWTEKFVNRLLAYLGVKITEKETYNSSNSHNKIFNVTQTSSTEEEAPCCCSSLQDKGSTAAHGVSCSRLRKGSGDVPSMTPKSPSSQPVNRYCLALTPSHANCTCLAVLGHQWMLHTHHRQMGWAWEGRPRGVHWDLFQRDTWSRLWGKLGFNWGLAL